MASAEAQRVATVDETETTTRLIYRQSVWTRITHWLWALSLFFMVLTGLQIFMAHPALYVGDQSGFSFDNEILRIGAENTQEGPVGYTEIFGKRFDTTGTLGLSGPDAQHYASRAFPSWATIPSGRDLATGRIVHFFFAWVLFFTLVTWFAASLVNGHAWRDLVPRGRDFKRLPADIVNHLRLRFHHGRSYNTLQKLSYFGVLFILLPLMFLSGMAMSPGLDAALPWLPDLLGGRQSARTLHFAVMLLLIGFFVIHIVMVLLAGPINELRSMITGWYRADAPQGEN